MSYVFGVLRMRVNATRAQPVPNASRICPNPMHHPARILHILSRFEGSPQRSSSCYRIFLSVTPRLNGAPAGEHLWKQRSSVDRVAVNGGAVLVVGRSCVIGCVAMRASCDASFAAQIADSTGEA
jgi:hypothetical protein